MTDVAGSEASEPAEVVILEGRAVDEMVGKIRAAAAQPGAAEAVAAWVDRHGPDLMGERGHDRAVVGDTLMFLHDGTLVPHARYPDGSEKVYTDAEHADSVY